jgi:hypothetical protein
MARKAIRQAVQDIADDGAGGRSHHADDLRQIGNLLLAVIVEQALGGQLLAAFFQQRHQRAGAGGLHAVDDDLVLGLAGKRGDAPGDDDLEALFGLDLQPSRLALPDHAGQHRAVVLEVKIDMARCRPGHPAQFAAHPNVAKGVLQRPLERAGDLGDRVFRHIRRCQPASSSSSNSPVTGSKAGGGQSVDMGSRILSIGCIGCQTGAPRQASRRNCTHEYSADRLWRTRTRAGMGDFEIAADRYAILCAGQRRHCQGCRNRCAGPKRCERSGQLSAR